MIPVPENHICKDIKRDIYYMETMNEPAANTQPIAARMSGIAPLTYVWLILTPFAIAVGQVLFKMTSEKLVASGAPFISVMFNPVFIAALALYGSATLLWIHVLKTVPLAYALFLYGPDLLSSLPLLAAWWLGETVGLKYAFGAGLIILGLVIVQS